MENWKCWGQGSPLPPFSSDPFYSWRSSTGPKKSQVRSYLSVWNDDISPWTIILSCPFGLVAKNGHLPHLCAILLWLGWWWLGRHWRWDSRKGFLWEDCTLFTTAACKPLHKISGIREKLTYLESLGIDSIWLSPFYTFGGVDLGNDVVNHTTVAKEFGTEVDRTNTTL